MVPGYARPERGEVPNGRMQGPHSGGDWPDKSSVRRRYVSGGGILFCGTAEGSGGRGGRYLRLGESPGPPARPGRDGRRGLRPHSRGLRRDGPRAPRDVRGLEHQRPLQESGRGLPRRSHRRGSSLELRRGSAGQARERRLRPAAPIGRDGRAATGGELAGRGLRRHGRARSHRLQPRPRAAGGGAAHPLRPHRPAAPCRQPLRPTGRHL